MCLWFAYRSESQSCYYWILYWCLVDTVNRTIFAWFFFFAFRDALWLLQWILGGRRKAAWKFFGSPLFQPLDDILHPLPVVFKADFSISVIERADFSHDPLQIHLLLACLPDVHWGGGTNISSGGGGGKILKKYFIDSFWGPQSHIPRILSPTNTYLST